MAIRTKIVIATLCIFLGWVGWTGLEALLYGSPMGKTAGPAADGKGGQEMGAKVTKTKKEWKAALTPEQYSVMIQCGTEPPFSGTYNNFWEKGTYFCAACGAPLFDSNTKYDHGTGWPSFTSPLTGPAVDFKDDFSLLMHRIEVRCASCGAHLGHVFDDGPGPDGKHYCINSVALRFAPFDAARRTPNPAAALKADTQASILPAARIPVETAVFAAGCFWGVEYKFDQVPGVLETQVGYTGGLTKNPSYQDVCTDATGHAEAVRVIFDPAKISYEDLVRKFFSFHDPTQLNRQGPDVGTQYRSAIFTLSEVQKTGAEKVRAEVEKSGAFRKRLVTDIIPAGEFYKAEEYHQKYYEKNKIKSCDF
jgi:peptide methionine sulfoxide reductase msrA/msrB